MHGVTDGEIRDRLMVNSKPVTGAYWFAPSEESLIALPRAAWPAGRALALVARYDIADDQL